MEHLISFIGGWLLFILGSLFGHWLTRRHYTNVGTPSASTNSENAQVSDNVEWDQLVGS